MHSKVKTKKVISEKLWSQGSVWSPILLFFILPTWWRSPACTPCPVSSSNLAAELEELCYEPLCLLGVQLTLSMIVLVFMFLYITIIFIHIIFSCRKPPFPFSWGPHLSTVCLLKFLNQAEVGICLFNRSIGVPKE